MTMRNARHSAGFTLVELLVALAIFMLIMGSLAMLLSGSISTVNQSYAMMNAMERARGAMAVLESDLKTAFVSPEKRQFFQFYGEPNGFMYSGQLVNGGFGRVTYAVHVDNANPPMQGIGSSETVSFVMPYGDVARQFARVLCPVSPDDKTASNIDKNDDGVPDITIAGVDASVTTSELDAWNAAKPNNGFDLYAERIFRQIYPGIAPADFEYPIEFTIRIQRGVLLRYEERGQSTLSEFSDSAMSGIFTSADGQSSIAAPFGSPAAAQSVLAEFPQETGEKLDRLQKNHYWVRMLSGNLPLNGVVDPFTPLPKFWAEDGRTDGKRWRDFVVTEGILVAAELVLPGTDQVILGQDSATGKAAMINALDMSSFFSFGIEDGSDRKSFNTLWNMPSVSAAGVADPGKPMFNYFLFGTPETFAEALRVQVYNYTPGDPLKTRLPAWVAPAFWIFGDPPRTGAPPFHQWFQQKVDIPSAYLRDSTGT